MTRNLYIGTGLGPVFRTRDVAEIPAAVGTLWREVLASDPGERISAIAEEIVSEAPDLVGLQEVASFEARPMFPGGEPPTNVDFLALLLAALAARGASYVAAAVQDNLDAELPDDRGHLVHFTDRDVILARAGVAARNARSARFTAAVEYEAGGVELSLPRGWVMVETETHGEPILFVNTHLEMSGFPRVQEAQARELVAALASMRQRTVLVGDLNSSADGFGGASYRIVRDAGFDDAWAALRAGDPGATCCFSSDLRSGDLAFRVDVVLHRGGFATHGVELVGAGGEDRIASGRWPSDHAGVVAVLEPVPRGDD